MSEAGREEAAPGQLADVLEEAMTKARLAIAGAAGDEAALARQVEFHQLTAEIAAEFLGQSDDGFEHSVRVALERIARFSGAEIGMLSLLDEEAGAWVTTHEWAAPGVEPAAGAVSGHRTPRWSREMLARGEVLHFRDVHRDLPDEAIAEREVWPAIGLRSLMVLPVKAEEGRLAGFAAFATRTVAIDWPREFFPLFGFAASMLSSAIRRQRLREELERSEGRLRNLLDAGVVGIVSADSEGRIWDANDIALAVLGYSRDDMRVGRIRWDAVTPPEYRPFTATALEQLAHAGCSQPWEQDIYRRDGSRLSLMVCLARIEEAPGSFLIYAVDITARKQAERELALRSRLSRLVTLLSTRFIAVAATRVREVLEDALREIGGVLGADQILVWTDEDAPSTLSNAMAVWTRPDRPQVDLGSVPSLDRSRFPNWIRGFRSGVEISVFDGGGNLPADAPERRFMKAFDIVSGVAVPMMSAGEPIGFATFASSTPLAWPESTVALLRRIGEIFAATIVRARTEEKRAAIHDQLERRIAERTAQLENANRELEAFSHAVSHDLRAPLRSVDGFSRILVEDHAEGLPEDARAILERVRGTSQRMGERIDALLRLSRIARQEPRFQAVELSRMAGEIAATLAAAEPTRQVAFDIEPGVVAQGEPRLLESLLDNLLRNAWKFTDGVQRAHVAFGSVAVDGERVFFVRDDGVGFDPSQAARVFTPFQRLHDPKRFEGHGVGLATVKRIVGVHGGRVWAEAAPNKGATIYFTLGPKAAA